MPSKKLFSKYFFSSGALDVNGSTVSSDEITNYILCKIKNNETTKQMDSKNVYLIPSFSKAC